jgi:hypothetical protein
MVTLAFAMYVVLASETTVTTTVPGSGTVAGAV